jgi:hypothetical protein
MGCGSVGVPGGGAVGAVCEKVMVLNKMVLNNKTRLVHTGEERARPQVEMPFIVEISSQALFANEWPCEIFRII